jgi:hypothetical protein
VIPDDLGNDRFKPRVPLQKLLGTMIEEIDSKIIENKKNFHFFTLGGTKAKNSNFKKFSKLADFLYSGIFGYGEHEFEGIFEF